MKELHHYHNKKCYYFNSPWGILEIFCAMNKSKVFSLAQMEIYDNEKFVRYTVFRKIEEAYFIARIKNCSFLPFKI